MKLTQEQYKQVIAKIDAVSHLPLVCPVCRGESWRVSINVVIMPRADSAPTENPYCYIPMVCSNCGYAIFFDPDALIPELGIRPRPTPQQSEL